MSLDLIIGCMFSGKSTEIMKQVNRLEKIESSYLLIKPIADNRYTHKSMIQTHDNLQRKCLMRGELIPIFESPLYTSSDYIIVEEAQFFEDLEPFVLQSVDKDKKKVIIVGLDGDSNRNNFGQIHKLIPLCDNITKLKAYCSQCKDGTEGIFSKRLIPDTAQTCIGSSDKYMAVCRKCYLE